jgi:hypothetical protein
MSKSTRIATIGSLALVGSNLLAAAPASAAIPVGVTVLAEEWTPSKTDSETLKVIEQNPTLLSDTLDTAWLSFRQWYLGTIPQTLQQQNYLHSLDPGVPTGISLYDRKGNTHLPPEMTLPEHPEFTIRSDGANMLRVNFIVPGTTISLCATTPTPVGQYGDPCATFSVDVALGMGIQISDVPGKTLTVTTANVTTSNFKVLDPNLPTEIVQGLAAVYAYLGGPNYQATLVHAIDTNKINVTAQLQAPVSKLDGMIQGYEQTAQTAINQLLQPAASIDRLLHVIVAVQSSGSGQTLAILLAPPITGVNFNPAGMTGQFKGVLTFDGSVKNPPASCSQLDRYPQITGQVQSGPRQVVSFNGSNAIYGTAPTQGLNLAFVGDTNPLSTSRSCPYTLEHLVVGFPNILNFSNFTFKPSGQAQISTNLEIQPSHWGNPVIVGANGNVISTGPTPSATQPAVARQVQTGSFTQLGQRTAAAGAASPGMPTNTVQGWTTNHPLSAQAVSEMNLIASQGVSFQPGVGAMPRQAQIGVVNTGDPLASKAVGTATQVQATQLPAVSQANKAISWGGATTAPAGGSSMRMAAPVGTFKPLQPAQRPVSEATAPSSLTSP